SGSFGGGGGFFGELLEALALGFGEEEDGRDQAEEADEGGGSLGGGEAVPGHEEGEGEDAEEASDLAHRGGNAVAGGADFDGKDLGGVDEGGGVGAELGEEVAEAVDNEKRPRESFDVGDQGEQAEGDAHHGEAEDLDGLAAEAVHGERGEGVAGDGEG